MKRTLNDDKLLERGCRFIFKENQGQRKIALLVNLTSLQCVCIYGIYYTRDFFRDLNDYAK